MTLSRVRSPAVLEVAFVGNLDGLPLTKSRKDNRPLDAFAKDGVASAPAASSPRTRSGVSPLTLRAQHRADRAGGTRVDLVDPSVHKSDRKLEGLHKVHYRGPLFKAGISAADCVQGAIGDCFVPSAMAAIAHVLPKKIEQLMKQNTDGTYTVRFKKYDHASKRFETVKVTVDGDLWMRNENDPLYGDGNTPTTPRRMEMWFPILEKAYAVFCGKDPDDPSYQSIGEGGYAEDVMEALLGRKGYTRTIPSYDEAALWREATRAVDEKRPMALGTYSPGEKRYSGTGLHGDHSYSVLGYEVDEKGKRFLIMRNPWGISEAYDDGKDDGIFRFPLDRAYRYFASLSSVR